jgi:carbon-monoxide dehydrogenase large subunit
VKFGAGQRKRRREDDRLVRGAGRFVADIREEGELYLALLRSVHAHAAIRRIETGAALACPGVVAVATGRDLAAEGVGAMPSIRRYEAPDGGLMQAPPRHLLAQDRVRHVGEPVAAVVARSQIEAENALEAITVDFEGLESVISVEEAVRDGAPLVWRDAGSNIVAMARFGDAGAVETAIGAAAHVVEITVPNQRLYAAPLEPRGAIAVPDPASGRVTLFAATQNPAVVRDHLAQNVLHWPVERLRIIVPDIGGGFGMKGYLYPEDALAAYFAGRLARPIRWIATRSEDFLGSTHARDQFASATLAFDNRLRATALRVRSYGNLGAYPAPSGPLVILTLGTKVATSVYDIPLVDIQARAVLTNTQATAPYRGAGRPEAIYLIERLFDEAAARLGRDPAELRRRSLIRARQLPYRTALGEVYDSGDFPTLLDRTLAVADWRGFAARRRQSRSRGLLRGRGLSIFTEWTGGNAYSETVRVTIRDNGRIELDSATVAMGQGLETTFVQMLAAIFDIDPALVGVSLGDTDKAQGFGSFGSRSLFVGGSAVALGAEAALEACRKRASLRLEADSTDLSYAAGGFRVAGTDRTIALAELAASERDRKIEIVFENTVASGSWPNGAHVCEVEIDPATGETRLVRYCCVDDVGIVFNPAIVEGQIHGGLAQGIGQALMEGVVYQEGSGQLLTASFQDYAIPRASDLPSFHTITDERWPCLTNPLGSKGAGESGTVGAPPAVMAAILDALRARGVRDVVMPATSQRVWRAICDAAAQAESRQHK